MLQETNQTDSCESNHIHKQIILYNPDRQELNPTTNRTCTASFLYSQSLLNNLYRWEPSDADVNNSAVFCGSQHSVQE